MNERILLTGASGTVGGHLLQQLLARGLPVRCMTRRPGDFDPGSDLAEVVQGDVLEEDSLKQALAGVSTAYYLIHSMDAGAHFAERDRRAAANFARAAAQAGVGHIIYLGGLGSGDDLSPHLASRQEVGRILRESGVATTEFRASIVIGAGSLSFRMVRALVERLPIMVTPRWVRTPAQPIGLDDLIAYLVAALERGPAGARVFEIGGADRTSYLGVMREYARQRGLRRWFLSVPVLTPALSSLWLKLVTPLYAGVGRHLIEGVRNPTLADDAPARAAFGIDPMGMPEAVARALVGGLESLSDERRVDLNCSAEQAFRPIGRIGGTQGWYYANWLWWLRGLIDRLLGGVGMRRNSGGTAERREGDALDFWRIEKLEPGRLLRLRAEMKVPGRAWLEFRVSPAGDGASVTQTARFEPRGVGGRLYWYVLYPVHLLIFRGMLARIARAACARRGGD